MRDPDQMRVDLRARVAAVDVPHPRRGYSKARVAAKASSISLISPAWNEEDYVERAVARAMDVLPKLTDDFEILIINDASTDRTLEICEGLAARNSRIRVISHQVNLKL